MMSFTSHSSRKHGKQFTAASAKSRIKVVSLFMGLICMAVPGPICAQDRPTLARANSAELQRLLQVQEGATVVPFSKRTPPRIPADAFDRLFMWNEIALDTTAIDHTPVQPGEHRVFGEQFGPTRASRAMAIIHIAMFDAADAIDPKYQSYTGIPPAPHDTSMDAAVAQAAHDTLAALYPSQAPSFDMLLADDLGHINKHGKGPKANGI